MTKPKKTKSGKWHLTVYLGRDEDGRRVYKSVTAETREKCKQEARSLISGTPTPARRPKIADLPRVCDAVDKYIDLCSVLSPTTICGYDKIRRTAFPHLMSVPIADLTNEVVQQAINTEARREGRRGRISPKTVNNEWSLIASALYHGFGLRFDVRLPRVERHLKNYPDPADVMRAVIGTEIELPCLLALWLSFSMSEIRGLKFSDLRGDVLTINRVLVDAGTLPTVKTAAKTNARIRRHRLHPYLLSLIDRADHSQEFIVPHNHDYIYDRFRAIMDRLGYEITFHDLRHLNASVMLAIGVPDKYAMERGGWSTPCVMRSVYQHTFSAERQRVDALVDGFFEEFLPKRRNKRCNKSPEKVETRAFRRGSIPLGSTIREEVDEPENR